MHSFPIDLDQTWNRSCDPQMLSDSCVVDPEKGQYFLCSNHEISGNGVETVIILEKFCFLHSHKKSLNGSGKSSRNGIHWKNDNC